MSVFSMQVVGRLPKAWFNLPQFLCIHEALHFRDQEILQFVQSLLYIYTPIYIYIYTSIHICIHIYICIYIYMYVCVPILNVQLLCSQFFVPNLPIPNHSGPRCKRVMKAFGHVQTAAGRRLFCFWWIEAKNDLEHTYIWKINQTWFGQSLGIDFHGLFHGLFMIFSNSQQFFGF
jgi:hypothetical protein